MATTTTFARATGLNGVRAPANGTGVSIAGRQRLKVLSGTQLTQLASRFPHLARILALG